MTTRSRFAHRNRNKTGVNRLARRRSLQRAVERLEPRVLLSANPILPDDAALREPPGPQVIPPLPEAWAEHARGGPFLPGDARFQNRGGNSNGNPNNDPQSIPLDDPSSIPLGPGLVDPSETFLLHSLPGAEKTIYLDFDGHTTTGTNWNSYYGIDPIVTPAYTFQGDSNSFTADELARIQRVWSRVAEDFAPFEVNVTTEDPGVEALRNTGGSDTQWGIRVVIGADVVGDGAGGRGYYNSFVWNSDTPVFVWNNSETGVTETASHEVGHALNLRHDGVSGGSNYYGGHGSNPWDWGPIMGASFNREISQWSIGEYTGADNNEDDLAIINSYLDYRIDDYGDTFGSAHVINPGGGTDLTTIGLIERNTDVDVFSFVTGGGTVAIDIDAAAYSPNVDLKAELFDSSQNLVVTSDSSTTVHASFNTTLAAGTYFLTITGVGNGDPATNGYSDYASLGKYSITGSANALNTIRFAMLGDYGQNSTAEADVASMVAAQTPDFIVTAGDNRYGSLTYQQAVGNHYGDYLPAASGGTSVDNRFFPSPGNHDYNDGDGINEYLAYFDLPGAGVTSTGTSGSERYYDVIEGDVHFFFIDSDQAISSSADRTAQQNWLQTQMSASTTAWQVVLLHHAPFSSANHGSNSTMQWDYAAWGADAVLAGHDHTYERISRNGIAYFVNGLGGRSIYNFNAPIPGSDFRYNSDYGAMIIEANAVSMTFEFLNRSGNLIDSHTIGTTPPPPTGVVDAQVSQSSDDAEERVSDGGVDLASTDIELGDDPGFNEDQTVGLRFQNLAIPQGATITAAYLEFETDETDTVATDIAIRAQDADSAATFTTVTNNITNRATTSASVNWSIPAWDTVDEKHQSPDLTAVVQEVVDRGGWTSGNSMAFIISGTGSRTAESYDGEAANSPKLHIEYATGNNSAPTANDDLVSTDEDNAVVVSVLSNDTDPDGDTLGISSFTQPTDGAVTDNGNGTLTYTPDADFNGSDSFTYTISDGNGGSDTATVNVTVNSVNDAPIAADDSAATDQDVAVVVNVLANDNDADGDTLSISSFTQGTSGAVTDNGNGTLTYTPSGGYVGADAFTYTISDGNGGTDTATVDVTVTAPPQVFEFFDVANSTSNVYGTTSGSYVDTHVADGTSQSVTEELYQKNRRSRAEQRWTFDVTGGDIGVSFYATAGHDSSAESFQFEYDAGAGWLPLFTLSSQSLTSYSAALPTSISGSVTVRVYDTNRSRNENVADTVNIDEMYFMSERSTTLPPRVSITASDAAASETGPDAGQFTVSLHDGIPQAADLTVYYTIDGSAGIADYAETLGGSVTIQAGQLNATIDITPVDDALPEPSEDVILTLASDAAYAMTPANSATVTIADNETSEEFFAESETSVFGTQNGVYTATHVNDGVYQTLTEERYTGGNKKSRLEHHWHFDLNGQTDLEFVLDAMHLSPSDPDNFQFQYTLDGGASWINLLTLTQSTTGVQTVAVTLPQGTSNVTVRVIDTDNSNDRSSASLQIDQLMFRPPTGPAASAADEFFSSFAWDDDEE